MEFGFFVVNDNNTLLEEKSIVTILRVLDDEMFEECK
jgi:hypothetical protein